MRRSNIARVLSCALLLAAAPAAAQTWQLFATGKTAKVYFDRASVREQDGYVHYRLRIEFGEPRDSRDRKHRYKSSVSALAAQCDARKVALTSVTLYDDAGTRLSENVRTPERWRQEFADVGADGLQARLLQHACALAKGESSTPPIASAAARTTIGAGIVVSGEGMVVTNHHVVRECASISVLDPQKQRTSATLVGMDIANDLALLKADRTFAAAASFRSGAPLQAGEAVTVVGYPLAGILGFEPNVTFGYVSAVGGLRGDASRFQISAPIHKGNSGGPILGQDGQVIGIVTSKLDALAVQRSTGDLPQNISFGVRGEIAQSFLEKHAVRFASGAGGRKLENTEVAAIGRSVTVLVACRQGGGTTP